MKTIILMILTLTLTTTIFASTESKNEERLCKVFTNKALSYEKTMRDDAYAKKTLESYESRAASYCSK
ncbi:MAG: hypothetical protein QM497_08980 [Sulfurimonas sp.]